MAGVPLIDPPALEIRGQNWFHHGWLYGILGLDEPLWSNRDRPVRDIDISAFCEGRAMALETESYNLIRSIRRTGQLIARTNPVL